jgi:hypothetical protein
MSGSRPAPERLDDTLKAIIELAQKLRVEPWTEYDKTLAAACLQLVQDADFKLRKVAKAISRVTPEETQPPAGSAVWWNDALDQVRD